MRREATNTHLGVTKVIEGLLIGLICSLKVVLHQIAVTCGAGDEKPEKPRESVQGTYLMHSRLRHSLVVP